MTPRTKREYLRQLVTEKIRWSRPLTDEEKALGFLGWHERGYLPHCDYPGLIQFVTFRLGDSMPASRRGEWEHLLAIEDVRAKRVKLEAYLDRGLGVCHLRDADIARLVEHGLMHFHNKRYDLLAWCVMPNHVHVLVHVWLTPLWKMVKGWKQFVAAKAQPILAERRPPVRRVSVCCSLPPGRRPALRAHAMQWEREYWDTFMRDEKQEKTAIRYIESNPVRAHLGRAPEEWPFSNARFRYQPPVQVIS
jgi:type I restriction enzyme R subunit/putative DNA methylase